MDYFLKFKVKNVSGGLSFASLLQVCWSLRGPCCLTGFLRFFLGGPFSTWLLGKSGFKNRFHVFSAVQIYTCILFSSGSIPSLAVGTYLFLRNFPSSLFRAQRPQLEVGPVASPCYTPALQKEAYLWYRDLVISYYSRRLFALSVSSHSWWSTTHLKTLSFRGVLKSSFTGNWFLLSFCSGWAFSASIESDFLDALSISVPTLSRLSRSSLPGL